MAPRIMCVNFNLGIVVADGALVRSLAESLFTTSGRSFDTRRRGVFLWMRT